MSTNQNRGCLGFLFGSRAPQTGLAASPAAQVQVKQYLLSASEASFFHVLRSVLRERAEVFVQIPLGHLIMVQAQSNSARTSLRNTFDRKSIDFLLCDPQGLRPLVAIELDDASHGQPRRQARDGEVERLLEAAGLPLVRFSCRRNYDTREIEAVLGRYLPRK